MAKRFWIVFSVVLIVFSIAGIAGASATYTYDGIAGGTWSDVNKSNVYGSPDSLQCWAAAASNSLSYGGWSGWDSGSSTYISTASDIYGNYVAAWPNAVGAATYAYEWWMTDRTQSIIPTKIFPSAGLNFYPTVHVQDGDPSGVTAFVQDTSVDDFLGTYIGAHRGIVGSIDIPLSGGGGTFGHSISVWGWDPVAMEIYITDSDDGITGLRTYSFHIDAGGFFVIDDYTNLYTSATDVVMDQLTRLNRNDLGIEPRKDIINGVPEPGTVLLLGSGLLGLVGYRRRKRMM